MNRFEAYPKLAVAGISIAILCGLLVISETTLTAFRDQLQLPEPTERAPNRYLVMREWPPGTKLRFRPPEARFNDPIGPIEKVYEIQTDKDGFIEPSSVYKKPDLEIAFLGGSTTECLYVKPEQRFPYLTAKVLAEETKLAINGLNAGRSGNNTMHSLLGYLGKVADRRPAFVVLMHATNDVAVLNSQKNYWNKRKGLALLVDETQVQRKGRVSQAIRRARDSTIPLTYRVVRDGFKAVRDKLAALFRDDVRTVNQPATNRQVHALPRNENAPSENLKQQRRRLMRQSFEPALRSFVRIAKAWGSEPVLMTQILVQPESDNERPLEGEFLSRDALRRGDFDESSFKSTHELANAIVRHVALSEGATLIDLGAARKWSNEDVYDGLHFTETGSRRVAEIIAEKLKPLVLDLSRERRKNQE